VTVSDRKRVCKPLVEKFMPAERELVRLALELGLVEKAKEAIGEDADFRTAVDVGVNKYLRQVERRLLSAGLTKPKPAAYRMRPMTPATLLELERVSERTGISKPNLIRACLTLVVQTSIEEDHDLENLIGLA
jgi:hypothetical protein